MKKYYLFFISLILSVTFLTGYANALPSICHCLEGYANHACCKGKQELPCHKHQVVKPTEEDQKKDCSCSISSDNPANSPITESPIDSPFLILWLAESAMPQDLLISHTIKPTWLRRLYYPDKSHFYLDTHRLLI